MMSAASMRSGARARDSRKRFGFSGCRALTWPNESTMPSRARMRFAVTSSSRTGSNLPIGGLQDEAHGAERAELMGVDENASLLDPETVTDPLEQVTVAADIFADALVAAEPVADEIRSHGDEVALDREN